LGLEHIAAVWEHSRRSGSHLVVLLAVASYSDHRGECIADQPTLQRRSRLGRRRVQQILEELVASGELAVVSHQGRGRLSTFRIQVGEKEKAQPSAPFAEPRSEKGEAECAFSAEKGEAECAFSPEKGAAEFAFSRPPCPPFPPDPQFPLNPPEKQETFGLRPLPGPQSAVFRVKLLLEEAGVPLPTPAQIGLWSKTLGGIEPLLELLARLVQAGLANKREPIVYAHRVVMERAARPEPARPLYTRNPVLMAGADEIRRQQALRIIAKERAKR